MHQTEAQTIRNPLTGGMHDRRNIMLTMKKVPMFGATAHNVKRLYETAFPVEQRVPW